MTVNDRHLLITYTWSINNIGDIGITPGLLSMVNRHYPDWRVHVLTSQPAGDSAVEYLREYLPKYHPCDLGPNPFSHRLGTPGEVPEGAQAWGAFHDRWGEHKLRAFAFGCLDAENSQAIVDDLLGRFPAEMLEQIRRENLSEADAFEQAGFVLYNSGTTFNFGRAGKRDFWTYALLFSMPLLLARHLKIPYGINAQSFDALDWPADLMYRRLFGDASFVYCRDSDSLEYLRQRNITNKRMGYRPDSTFFFGGVDDEWLGEFMQTHQLKKGSFVALIIRTSRNSPQDPLLGVMNKDREQANMDKLVEFIEQWLSLTKTPIVLCPEVRWEIGAAKDYLYDRLSPESKRLCVWMSEFWTTEQAYSLFSASRLVISMEMHSVIMAISVGTPVLHPQFREAGRKARMVRDLGLGDWLMDIDEISSADLLKTAMAVHEDYDGARKLVSQPAQRLRDLGKSVLDEVSAYLDNGPLSD